MSFSSSLSMQIPQGSAAEISSHNRSVLRTLEKGDIVKVDRGHYNHFGIYTGDGFFIELVVHDDVNTVELIAPTKVNGIIQEVDLGTFANGCKVYKCNDRDAKHSPFEKEEIVKRAESKIGPCEYDLYSYNCEHFVNWCRYDVKVSKQIRNVATGTAAAGGAIGVYITRMLMRRVFSPSSQ